MAPAAAEVRFDDGRLGFAWGEGFAAERVAARCHLMDGSQFDSAEWRRDERARGGEARFMTRCGPLELRLEVGTSGSMVAISLSAVAVKACDIRDIGIAFGCSIKAQPPRWVVYNGYQSWDAAGHASLLPSQPQREYPRRDSWWTCAVADVTGAGLAMVAQSAERSATRFEARGSELALYASAAEGLTTKTSLWQAKRAGRWHGEGVHLAAGMNVYRLLGELASRTAQARDVPRGWLSWYHYGAWVSRQDVLENAAVIADGRFRDLGLRYVQIDDGWQEAYGEWRANAKFAPDLRSLTDRLHASGQVPGIWTAPFLVSASADLAQQAPDTWFLRDSTGERAVDHRHTAFGPMYILDARKAEVCAHLGKVFDGLYKDGFRYFKIDFLYAGAYAGVEALRAGVAAIRAAVKDSYLLGCGAPLLPLSGIVDGCRIGQDTASPMYNFELGSPSPTIFGSEIESVARNIAARHFLRAWFQLDPDVALVGGNLNLRQARQLITAVVLSGGPFFASDDLRLLPEDRLSLLSNPEVLELVGRATAVPDWQPPEQDLPPAVWRLGSDVLAAFNWTDLERSLKITIEGTVTLRDLWERRPAGVVDGCLQLDLEPLGVRLLRLSRA